MRRMVFYLKRGLSLAVLAGAFVSALRGTEQPLIAALGGLVGGSVQPQAQGSAPKSADSGEDDQ